MKFTIALTKSDREEIAEAREIVAAQLAEINGKNRKLNKLLELQATLNEEIRGLELSDPDKAAAKMLSEARAELELVDRRIREFPAMDTQAEISLRSALRESTHLIVRVLLPCHQAYAAGIMKAIRPFVISDDWARELAGKTQAVQQHGARLWRDYSMGNPIAEAAEVVRRFDEITSGQFEWEFDAKLS